MKRPSPDSYPFSHWSRYATHYQPTANQISLKAPPWMNCTETELAQIRKLVEDRDFRQQVTNRIDVGKILDETHPAFTTGCGGFGAFARAFIPKGSILPEYVGEVTTRELFDKSISLETELTKGSSFDLKSTLEWFAPDQAAAKGGTSRHPTIWSFRSIFALVLTLLPSCFAIVRYVADTQNLLVIDPSEYIGLMSFANDYRIPDMKPKEDRQRKKDCQNVLYREVLVDGWPRIFTFAKQDIQETQELLCDYGEAYWVDFYRLTQRADELQKKYQKRDDVRKLYALQASKHASTLEQERKKHAAELAEQRRKFQEQIKKLHKAKTCENCAARVAR